MKQKRRKRGFTIVELVIVIAVIAILAAVLIPTFSNLIAKANLSNDQQVVRILNTTLTYGSVTKTPENMQDAVDILTTEGYHFMSMKPRSSDCSFVWEKTKNQILLIDGNGAVIYPEGAVTTDVQMFVSSDRDVTAGQTIVTTYVLNNNLVASTLHFQNKTLDLNGYTLHYTGTEADAQVGSISNGFVSDLNNASLQGKLGSDVKEIVNASSNPVKTTPATIKDAIAWETNGENNVAVFSGKQFQLNETLTLDTALTGENRLLTCWGKEVREIIFDTCVFDGSKPLEVKTFDKVQFKNCIFRTTDQNAGALIAWYDKDITVENCRFEGALRGIQVAAKNTKLENLVIRNNYFSLSKQESDSCMAIQLAFDDWAENVSVEISGNTFNYCYGAIRIHETFMLSDSATNLLGKNADVVGMLKEVTDLSWIKLSGNVYNEQGCPRKIYLDYGSEGTPDSAVLEEFTRIMNLIEVA